MTSGFCMIETDRTKEGGAARRCLPELMPGPLVGRSCCRHGPHAGEFFSSACEETFVYLCHIGWPLSPDPARTRAGHSFTVPARKVRGIRFPASHWLRRSCLRWPGLPFRKDELDFRMRSDPSPEKTRIMKRKGRKPEETEPGLKQKNWRVGSAVRLSWVTHRL